MNLANLKKEEIIKRHYWRCVHGHTGLEHPKCYEQAHGVREKIGFLDIEASNTEATFGLVLTYCIKEENGKIYYGKITPEEIKNGTYDRNLLKKCIKDMKRFDRLVYYWGGDNRFDIPFLRSRAVLYNLDFPLYKEIKGLDLYTYIKKKFRFHRNRLETACEFFGIPAKAHPIKFDVWVKALGGNQKALNYILTHNKEDVISLEKLYHKVLPYINIPNTSI